MGGCESNHSGAEDPLQRPETQRLTRADACGDAERDDAQRLQSVLDGIADESSAGRWASLDQLRYFARAPTPRSSRPSAASALNAGGAAAAPRPANGLRVPARTAADERQRVPVGNVLHWSAYYATPPQPRRFSSPQTAWEPINRSCRTRRPHVRCRDRAADPRSRVQSTLLLHLSPPVPGDRSIYRARRRGGHPHAAGDDAYTRTLARPATALLSRPLPLACPRSGTRSRATSASPSPTSRVPMPTRRRRSCRWAPSSRSSSQPILCSPRAMAVAATGQHSLTFVTEQVLSPPPLVWPHLSPVPPLRGGHRRPPRAIDQWRRASSARQRRWRRAAARVGAAAAAAAARSRVRRARRGGAVASARARRAAAAAAAAAAARRVPTLVTRPTVVVYQPGRWSSSTHSWRTSRSTRRCCSTRSRSRRARQRLRPRGAQALPALLPDV